MSSRGQLNITLPEAIVLRLDEFLNTEKSKQIGYTSRPQVVLDLLRDFLDEHHPIPLESAKDSKIELVGTLDKKIILEDSVIGTITVVIDKDSRLMCYKCKEDPHSNKYIDFVSENEELWDFLKRNKVKYLTVRDNNHN